MSKAIEVKVEIQGAPVINHGYIYADGEKVVALAVDMESKWCSVDAVSSDDSGAPEIIIAANEHSLYLNPGADVGDLTAISFSQYAGWSVWASEISKYTLAVCLTKDGEIDDD